MDASLTPDQIDAILANADENGDGSLDFSEFMKAAFNGTL